MRSSNGKLDRESQETFKNLRRGLRELRWALEAAQPKPASPPPAGATPGASGDGEPSPAPTIGRAIRFVTVTRYSRAQVDGPFCEYVTTPEIRVRGNWLDEAGFSPGIRIRIRVTHGRLTLEWDDGTE